MNTLTGQSNSVSLTAEDLDIYGRLSIVAKTRVLDMCKGDERDAERVALCREFSHGHATCAAELHAYLAFGQDTRE